MPPIPIAQAMVEHGLLDAMVASVAAARDRLEIYVGQGNAGYTVGVVVVIVLLLLVWRR
jgi:hypothetical protein